ncbi:MAG: HRDC domain-containing protein [Anaerolineae bacterium]|nr:HRDC domain-containing protein [Anaerolineae bacterium]
MESLPEPILIINQSDLKELTKKLQRSRQIAVDTESNSLFAYRERVCLIQFTIRDGDYLVDPLAVNDLSLLGPVFENPKIEKIFHAAEYDLLVMKRDYGFKFANLFDTMLAARIVGRDKVGLGSLLEEIFGVKVEKKFQRADWGKRPLSSGMLRYASMDTHFLIDLRKKLAGELDAVKRMPIAEEDFVRLCEVNGEGPAPRKINIWRMNGVRDLSPEEAAILQELAVYRQAQAEKIDLPLFKVITDKTLVAIAASRPTSMYDFNAISGMTPGQVKRHGKGLLQAVQRGLAAKPSFQPRRPRIDEDLAERIEALRNWRKERAKEMGVESDVILPKDIMIALANKNPGTPEGIAEIMADLPWRLKEFGREIGSTLNHKQ